MNSELVRLVEQAAVLADLRVVGVEELGGSSVGSVVLRIRGADAAGEPRSVVLKRYARDLDRSIVCGLLPGVRSFARVLRVDRERNLVVFEDVGTLTLGAALRRDDADRSALVTRYLDAVRDAHQELGALSPVTATGSSVAELAGFEALSAWPDGQPHLVPELLRLPGITATSPTAIAAAAAVAEIELVALLREQSVHRRWILADANPFNLVLDPAASSSRWVDAVPVVGFPDTNLVTLGGAAFRLTPKQAWACSAGLSVLGEQGLATLNGLYSLFTLIDTGLGLTAGSRDGGQDYAMGWSEVCRFSLEVARDYLALGWEPGRELLPLVDWLQFQSGRS